MIWDKRVGRLKAAMDAVDSTIAHNFGGEYPFFLGFGDEYKIDELRDAIKAICEINFEGGNSIQSLTVLDEATSANVVSEYKKWAESPEGKAWQASPQRPQFISTEPVCKCPSCERDSQ